MRLWRARELEVSVSGDYREEEAKAKLAQPGRREEAQ